MTGTRCFPTRSSASPSWTGSSTPATTCCWTARATVPAAAPASTSLPRPPRGRPDQEGGGFAAAHPPGRLPRSGPGDAPRTGYGAAPPASRLLAHRLRRRPCGPALTPGDPCGPWRQEKRAGPSLPQTQRAARPATGGHHATDDPHRIDERRTATALSTPGPGAELRDRHPRELADRPHAIADARPGGQVDRGPVSLGRSGRSSG